MRIKLFNRYELKYLLTIEQSRAVIEALSDYMSPDTEGDERGRYHINSLYYDTYDYKAYWDKIEGHRYRRKVRVRIYGDPLESPDSPCYVEIKQRLNKTLQKRRIILPYTRATALCGQGQELEANSEIEQRIIDEVLYLNGTLQLQPACIVSYDRLAIEGSEYDIGLRVTFDTNLKGRTHALSLLAEEWAENRFFIPPQWCIMEIKVNYRVPYWLTEIIGRDRCTLRRISKYCTALEQSKALLNTQRILY
jgi:hypothetical protein